MFVWRKGKRQNRIKKITEKVPIVLNGIVGAFSVIFFKVYDPDEGKRALIL